MDDRPAPGGLPSLYPLLPPSVAPVLLALLVVYVTIEAAFLARYRRVLIGNANRRTDPAPYRDYPDVSDRHLLLRRIVARLGRRGRRRRGLSDSESPEDGGGDAVGPPSSRPSPAGPSLGEPPDESARVYYDFIESWFVRRPDDDVPYEQFSEQLDRLGPGLLRPSPSMLRLARWSFADGPSYPAKQVDDADEGSSNRSSYESLPVLEGEVEAEDVAAAGKRSLDGGGVVRLRCEDSVNNDETISDDRLRRGNLDEFLSWAFFGTSYSSASADPSKVKALEGFYEVLEKEAGLTFEPGTHPSYRPRSFTLEDVRSLYRPHGVYAAVALAKGGTNLTLRLLGFRRHACGRGLAYWHRPPDRGRRLGQGMTPPPFLFFHGIAPGGHAPYAPMLLLGLLRGDDGEDEGRRRGWRERHVFLFENSPISYALETTAVCEGDTAHGVAEAVALHVDVTSDGGTRCALTVCGHSFGSCVVTWLLRSPVLRDRIGTALLLDPVSICLSDPDVVVNFLYHSRDCGPDGGGDTRLGRLARFANETKIRLVASSELGIETYLRRSFAWYNSELWLEDVAPSTRVYVFLSSRDEIVNSPGVTEEISCHNRRVERGKCGGPVVESAVWEDAGHANCVTNPGRWRDMRERLRAAEEAKRSIDTNFNHSSTSPPLKYTASSSDDASSVELAERTSTLHKVSYMLSRKDHNNFRKRYQYGQISRVSIRGVEAAAVEGSAEGSAQPIIRSLQSQKYKSGEKGVEKAKVWLWL
ncbi:hypothetical protein THAOC_04638 [Thalassiosira oceanica]|uniref:AB hydrolase-1 domain-containing protein n=1 Tax=Thalassiosira oceanica TaxID=159749 RepID=K0T9I9_THAOC|nr:hypothetical protein THAOC_04638 [Thalassiosira oceanica]|eukprot:EJK73724.1 hypothetical protein THAOC_04638 [Thalassiosira oceanica]